MEVQIRPQEMHDFAGIYGATVRAFKDGFGEAFLPSETLYIAAVSLLGPSFDDEGLVSFCRCIRSLSSRRIFLGKAGAEIPLPPYDPEAKESPLFFSCLDIFFALYGFYLFVKGEVTAPEEAIRPISFLLYEAWEGLKDGLENLNGPYAPIYQRKMDQIRTEVETLQHWKAHLEFVEAFFQGKA